MFYLLAGGIDAASFWLRVSRDEANRTYSAGTESNDRALSRTMERMYPDEG